VAPLDGSPFSVAVLTGTAGPLLAAGLDRGNVAVFDVRRAAAPLATLAVAPPPVRAACWPARGPSVVHSLVWAASAQTLLVATPTGVYAGVVPVAASSDEGPAAAATGGAGLLAPVVSPLASPPPPPSPVAPLPVVARYCVAASSVAGATDGGILVSYRGKDAATTHQLSGCVVGARAPPPLSPLLGSGRLPPAAPIALRPFRDGGGGGGGGTLVFRGHTTWRVSLLRSAAAAAGAGGAARLVASADEASSAGPGSVAVWWVPSTASATPAGGGGAVVVRAVLPTAHGEPVSAVAARPAGAGAGMLVTSLSPRRLVVHVAAGTLGVYRALS